MESGIAEIARELQLMQVFGDKFSHMLAGMYADLVNLISETLRNPRQIHANLSDFSAKLITKRLGDYSIQAVSDGRKILRQSLMKTTGKTQAFSLI
jgi:hypothetical protein